MTCYSSSKNLIYMKSAMVALEFQNHNRIASHMWPQKWDTVWLWFWLICIVKCGTKNNPKPHHTIPRTPVSPLGFVFIQLLHWGDWVLQNGDFIIMYGFDYSGSRKWWLHGWPWSPILQMGDAIGIWKPKPNGIKEQHYFMVLGFLAQQIIK